MAVSPIQGGTWWLRDKRQPDSSADTTSPQSYSGAIDRILRAIRRCWRNKIGVRGSIQQGRRRFSVLHSPLRTLQKSALYVLCLHSADNSFHCNT